MIFKLPQIQKIHATQDQIDTVDRFYLVRYIVILFMFAGVLTLSVLNNFMFFGWLSISSAIIVGLMTIHLIGQNQIKRN